MRFFFFRMPGSFGTWATSIASVIALALLAACLGDDPGTAQDSDAGGGIDATARLVFRTELSDQVAGEPFAPAVQVEIQDAEGNLIVNGRPEITLALGGGAGEVAHLGTARTEEGRATFEGLKVERAASDYHLVASGAGLAAAKSKTFAVRPAAAERLAFATVPTKAETHEPLAPAVEVEVRDRFGNRTPEWTGKISVSLEKNPGSVTLAGNLTTSAAEGVGRFTDLSLSGTGKGFTLWAEAPGLSAAESTPFDVRLTFASVSAGGRHTCGVTQHGKVYCWGDGADGQLGNGGTAESAVPVLVSTGVAFATVSAGVSHTCGVSAAGKAYCWGVGEGGRLGNGETDSPVPVLVSSALTFSMVRAAELHTCGVTTTGQAYCWGQGEGRLGNVDEKKRVFPEAVLGSHTFKSVDARAGHTCGLTTAGKAYCWGDGTDGRLGDGDTAQRLQPVAVSGEHTFDALTVGAYHTCGLTTAGKAYCWGDGEDGRLGTGNENTRHVPTAVSGSLSFVALSADVSHTCGVTKQGKAYCWGSGHNRLGNGGTDDQLAPEPVSSAQLFDALSAGSSHTCGVTKEGQTLCWGDNTSGQLGTGEIGSEANSAVPVTVSGTER